MKILVIRFSSIGDLVLTTPVIRCLHRQLGAEVHVLTKAAFAPLLSDNPYVRRIYIWEEIREGDMDTLTRERFDQVVDLHNNLRSWKVRLALGRPSVAFDKLNIAKWLRVRLGWDILPHQHLVDRYFEGMASLGVIYDGEGLDHFIPADAAVDPGKYLPENTPFAVAVLGAAHATKQIPAGKYRDILSDIAGPVLLIGGPAEQAEGEAMAAIPSAFPRVNLAGQLSLQQSADVIRRSAVVLTPDTGMMHLAAALRKPVVTVWGNTIPAFGMYPFYPDGMAEETRFEVGGLSCRPCSKLGAPQCPKGHFRCMNDQPAAAIARAVEARLIPSGAGRHLPNGQ